jgi:hypothetical protein
MSRQSSVKMASAEGGFLFFYTRLKSYAKPIILISIPHDKPPKHLTEKQPEITYRPGCLHGNKFNKQ